MIYLIKIKNTNYIKIGYTIRPKERFLTKNLYF